MFTLLSSWYGWYATIVAFLHILEHVLESHTTLPWPLAYYPSINPSSTDPTLLPTCARALQTHPEHGTHQQHLHGHRCSLAISDRPERPASTATSLTKPTMPPRDI